MLRTVTTTIILCLCYLDVVTMGQEVPTFYLTDTKGTWEQGKAVCEARGDRLAVLDTEEKLVAAREMCLSNAICSDTDYPRWYVGATTYDGKFNTIRWLLGDYDYKIDSSPPSIFFRVQMEDYERDGVGLLFMEVLWNSKERFVAMTKGHMDNPDFSIALSMCEKAPFVETKAWKQEQIGWCNQCFSNYIGVSEVESVEECRSKCLEERECVAFQYFLNPDDQKYSCWLYRQRLAEGSVLTFFPALYQEHASYYYKP